MCREPVTLGLCTSVYISEDMTRQEREKRIDTCERYYFIGVVACLLAFMGAALCLFIELNVLGYILLGLSVVIAAAAGGAQVYGSILESDQIYIDHGMTPPRYRSKQHAYEED